MVLYHLNSPYYRQFLTTKGKDAKKNDGKNQGGPAFKSTEKRSMVRDDWDSEGNSKDSHLWR